MSHTPNLIPFSRKLNLGCGSDVRREWINLDAVSLPGVDVVHNLESLPLPFANGVFEKILCRSILEHVEYPSLLSELHRILAPGGSIRIQVPHFTSSTNFIDPTHKKFFSVRTFEFFVKDSPYAKRAYYFSFHFQKMRDSRIVFEKKGFFFCNRFVEPIVNLNRTMQCLYEDTFFSRLFPATTIVLTLIK